jgi:hypothetical protein
MFQEMKVLMTLILLLHIVLYVYRVTTVYLMNMYSCYMSIKW